MTRECSRGAASIIGKHRTGEGAVCASDTASHTGETKTCRRNDRKESTAVQHTHDLARREALVICRLKWILVLTLLCFASAVASLTYVVLSRKEHRKYMHSVSRDPCALPTWYLPVLQVSSQYNRFVSTIETAIHFHLQSIEGGMTRFSAVVSAEAKRENSTWPFVTVRAFEAVGAAVREQTGFEEIVLMPLVTRQNVDAWQDYSVQKASSWLYESRAIAESAAIKAMASGEYNSFVATDYVDAPPTPVLIDLEDAFEKAARGENYTYALSGPVLANFGRCQEPVPSGVISGFGSLGPKSVPTKLQVPRVTWRATKTCHQWIGWPRGPPRSVRRPIR
jgi:hypothetical protein